MKKIIKILKASVFIAILGMIFYVAFIVDYEQPYKINVIEINGGEHLSTEKYFSYAGLDDKSKYDELTLPIIKSRLEKHPYVKRADVLYVGDGKVEVKITEKDFMAILMTGDKEFILTSDFEVLPVLPYTMQINIPVITDNKLSAKIKAFDYVGKNDELIPVFKIFDVMKMVNPQLFDNLSEIARVNEKDFNLYFTFANYDLIIDRRNAIDEIYKFNALWKYLDGNSIIDELEYVDLRYNGKIFLGFEEKTAEGNKS